MKKKKKRKKAYICICFFIITGLFKFKNFSDLFSKQMSFQYWMVHNSIYSVNVMLYYFSIYVCMHMQFLHYVWNVVMGTEKPSLLSLEDRKLLRSSFVGELPIAAVTLETFCRLPFFDNERISSHSWQIKTESSPTWFEFLFGTSLFQLLFKN